MRWAISTLVTVLFACVPSVAPAQDPPDPGQTTPTTIASNGTEYRYVRYTPASYVPGRAAPLLVMVHGCQTTAEQQMRANRFNALAEREGFVVLYPDVDAIGRLLPGPANQCWKFPYPPAWAR
ncbi:MAG TPA: PHB depolymerase family esterase, partial [Solirubrobacteraceae bacterium]